MQNGVSVYVTCVYKKGEDIHLLPHTLGISRRAADCYTMLNRVGCTKGYQQNFSPHPMHPEPGELYYLFKR